MKLYKTTISQESAFATELRGDTLFGQLCWAIRYLNGEERLKKLLSSYCEKPFAIISDPFPKDHLPKPKMPSKLLGEDPKEKKENRKKLWMKLEDLKNGAYDKAKRDEEIKLNESKSFTVHNAINYKTFHTGDGFDPYALQEYRFDSKDIYFLIDEEQLGLDEFEKALLFVSRSGYGQDTTIGKGRFIFDKDFQKVELESDSTSYMTLSPFSPEDIVYEKLYYEPFVRFGKFGHQRAYTNAFKKPLLLADTASVIKFTKKPKYLFAGKAITNISERYKDAVHQGYSIIVPIKEIA